MVAIFIRSMNSKIGKFHLSFMLTRNVEITSDVFLTFLFCHFLKSQKIYISAYDLSDLNESEKRIFKRISALMEDSFEKLSEFLSLLNKNSR